MVKSYFLMLRPSQWTKNVLVFSGLVFSLHAFQPHYLDISITAFGLFCVIASSGYIINDLFDLPVDSIHPRKSKRPIASGAVKPVTAGVFAGILCIVGIVCAFLLDREFGALCLFYFILMLFYSMKLKHIVILDVLIIATGFVVRVIAGTAVIDVEISKWLLVCTIFLSLFLALSKRLSELHTVNNGKEETRKILKEYNALLLTQLISISAASTLIAYTLYTVDDLTIQKFGTMNLVYTVPFVIYGIFRYMYLVYTKDLGENPELILLTDKPTLINILMYVGAVLYILYFSVR
jgi:4-hydroxybenzoate polyprenyltransferase